MTSDNLQESSMVGDKGREYVNINARINKKMKYIK
jgi:hypothetical protein